MTFDIWTNFTTNFMEYSLSAYSSMEPFVYPLIFLAIIGYIFAATQSVVTTVVAIIITFASFGTVVWIWEPVEQVSIFLYIVTIIGLTMLIVGLMLKLSRTE